MKQELIDNFVMQNSECFDSLQIQSIQQALAQVDDSKAPVILGQSFQKPTVILIIAIVLGWDRFFLDDVVMGILKYLTGCGCGIWWILDIFSAKKRTTDYNFKKFNEALNLCK